MSIKMESEDLTSLPLAIKKKWATTQKSVFTRHLNTLQRHLNRWRADPVSGNLEKVVAESLLQVREDKERILEIYECIEADDSVSEQVFASTFQPRMVDIHTALEEAETHAAEMNMRCCEARAGQRDPA